MPTSKNKIDKTKKEWIVPNVTVAFNCGCESLEQDIEFNKGNLPLLLFYQSLNGSPCFETHDSMEDISNRYVSLLTIGRNPQIYLKLKMKDNKQNESKMP